MLNIFSLSKTNAGVLIGLVLTVIAMPSSAMDVYLFRGLVGVPFSTGLDTLGNELKNSGIRAQVYPYTMWKRAYSTIKRRGAKKIVLIGHSMGVMSTLFLARELQDSEIKVAYLGAIDVPLPLQTVPWNVSWVESYVSDQPGFSVLERSSNSTRLVINTHVSGTMHTTVDDSKRVHNSIISAIWLADSSTRKVASVSPDLAQ